MIVCVSVVPALYDVEMTMSPARGAKPFQRVVSRW